MGEHKTTHDRRKAPRSTERRNRVREVISAPVRVRGVTGPDRKFEETTTTINLSPTGILIETSSDTYYRSMRLSVTIPFQESTADVQTERDARVVRISEPHQGRRTVAIELSQAEEQVVAQPTAAHRHHEKEKKSHAVKQEEVPAAA